MRFLAAWGGFGAVVLACVLATGGVQAQEGRIAVLGEGRVVAVPDMAVLSLGVEARAETGAEAMAQLAGALGAVRGVIGAAGVADADVQTGSLFLQPVYEQTPDRDGPPVQTGLVASSDLTVRLRDVSALGALLDQVTAAGGNRFSGLSWDVQDRAPLIEQARRAAVADGMAKAALYAGAAGVALGPLVQMAEDGAETAPGMMMMEAASLRAMPVAPGEIEIAARLRMVFALGD